MKATSSANSSATRPKSWTIWRFTNQPARADAVGARVVGHDQEQRQQHHVGHDRAAAVGDERQRHAGQGDHARHAADDHEHLQREYRREAGGQQLREAVPGEHRGLEAAVGEEQVRPDQPGARRTGPTSFVITA